MIKQLHNFLHGMGSVLEIAPATKRRVLTHPLYRRHESNDAAIQHYWLDVGDYLRQAISSVDREQAAQEESS